MGKGSEGEEWWREKERGVACCVGGRGGEMPLFIACRMWLVSRSHSISSHLPSWRFKLHFSQPGVDPSGDSSVR